MDHEQPLFLSNGGEAEYSDLYEDNLPRKPLHQVGLSWTDTPKQEKTRSFKFFG